MATAEKEKTPAKATGATKATGAKKRGRKPGTKMSAAQKAALAEGREAARKVNEYLEALDRAPTRGRKVTKETLAERLANVEDKLAGGVTPIERLRLTQEKMDIEHRLKTFTDNDISAFEAEFVKAAKPYAKRHKISRAAFKALGVPVKVLKEAGV